MDDTFLLSNIVPQDIDNNGDFWNRTEIYCRDLTKKYSDVRIISGPLWLPVDSTESLMKSQGEGQQEIQRRILPNGRPRKEPKIMSYPVIGQNEVAVPTHLYKVIMAEDPSLEMPLLSAFVVPNRPIPKDKTLFNFKVPLDSLERKVGVRFHSRLNRNSIEDLCTVEGCSLMNYREFQTFFINRGIKNARNINELERYWRQATKHNLASETEIQRIYNERINELQQQAPTSPISKTKQPKVTVDQMDMNKLSAEHSQIKEELENQSTSDNMEGNEKPATTSVATESEPHSRTAMASASSEI